MDLKSDSLVYFFINGILEIDMPLVRIQNSKYPMFLFFCDLVTIADLQDQAAIGFFIFFFFVMQKATTYHWYLH